MSDFEEKTRSRGKSHGAAILSHIQKEHLNRYAFVKQRNGTSWHKRFLELNPKTKKLSWWHNRTSCGKAPMDSVALSAIGDIVYKPSSRSSKLLEELTKYEGKIADQQKQMMLIRKKADLEEKIETEKFVGMIISKNPKILKKNLSQREQDKFDEEMRKRYSAWQEKRRKESQVDDVNFQLAATEFLDFRRNFYERLRRHRNSKKVLKRLQEKKKKVNELIYDQDSNLDDYSRVLKTSREQYMKTKKKLADRAKKRDYILIVVLKKRGKKYRFRFSNPQEASHWKTYIEEDQIYEAPDHLPKHFHDYEPEDHLQRFEEDDESSGLDDDDDDDDYFEEDDEADTQATEGTGETKDGAYVKKTDGSDSDSSDEYG